MSRGRKFQVDRANGKIMGVCAGISAYTGVDVTLIRVAAVLITIAGAFPWTLLAYGAAALLAKPKRSDLDEEEHLAMPRGSRAEVRESMRDIDRRIAEVESYVTSSNSRLEREFEQLR